MKTHDDIDNLLKQSGIQAKKTIKQEKHDRRWEPVHTLFEDKPLLAGAYAIFLVGGLLVGIGLAGFFALSGLSRAVRFLGFFGSIGMTAVIEGVAAAFIVDEVLA